MPASVVVSMSNRHGWPATAVDAVAARCGDGGGDGGAAQVAERHLGARLAQADHRQHAGAVGRCIDGAAFIAGGRDHQ